jgi:hypothetical protein
VRHWRYGAGVAENHIEIRVIAPKGAPIPVTSTGYRSHFLSAEEVRAAGDAKAYVTAWLDHEAQTKASQEVEFAWRQLSFDLTAPRQAQGKARRPGKSPARLARRTAGKGSA